MSWLIIRPRNKVTNAGPVVYAVVFKTTSTNHILLVSRNMVWACSGPRLDKIGIILRSRAKSFVRIFSFLTRAIVRD